MTKILMIGPGRDRAKGLSIYTDKISSELRESGFTVLRAGQNEKSDFKINLKSPRLYKEVNRIVSAENIDIVHVQHIPSLFGFYRGINLCNVDSKVVTTFHEPDSKVPYNWYSIRSRLRDLAQKKLINSSNKAIVHLEKNKEELSSKYDCSNIEFIPHGVDYVGESQTDFSVEKALVFGFISDKRDYSSIFDLCELYPELEFIIAGKSNDVELSAKIREKSRQLTNLKESIGWISEKEKRSLFKEADLVLMPYKNLRSASGVLSDSLANGRPFIATENPAFEQAAEKGAGLTVGLENLDEAMEELIASYPVYLENAQQLGSHKSWPNIADDHIEVYNEL